MDFKSAGFTLADMRAVPFSPIAVCHSLMSQGGDKQAELLDGMMEKTKLLEGMIEAGYPRGEVDEAVARKVKHDRLVRQNKTLKQIVNAPEGFTLKE